MVKPEDEVRFVGHIKKEASRLVSLIQDIIRLSQLDEGVEASLFIFSSSMTGAAAL